MAKSTGLCRWIGLPPSSTTPIPSTGCGSVHRGDNRGHMQLRPQNRNAVQNTDLIVDPGQVAERPHERADRPSGRRFPG